MIMLNPLSSICQNDLEEIRIFDTNLDALNLPDYCYVLADSTNTLNIDDVRKINPTDFIPTSELEINLDPDYTYWGTFNVNNPDTAVTEWVIYFATADYIELYQYDQTGKLVISKRSGELVPRRDHDFIDLMHAFRVNIYQQQTMTFYLKFWNKTTYPVYVSPVIYPEIEVIRDHYVINVVEMAIQGLFFGALIIMMLYNLLVYITTRERTYAYYTLYILTVTAFLMYKYFYLYMFITGSRYIDKVIWAISINVPIIFYLLFVMHFLDLKGNVRKWIRTYAYLKSGLVVLFLGILIVTFDLKLLNQVTNTILIIELLLIIPPILYQSRQGAKLEKYILIGTGTLYLFVFINLGLWVFNIRTIYGYEIFYFTEIGIIGQIIFFSYGLAKRVQFVEEEKRVAEQRLVENMKRMDKLKDEFLANTSHELRTPLQGIIGLSETLYEQEKDQVKKKELNMITTSGKRLASLVNSILDFSKLKTHELRLAIKAIDIRIIAETVIHICRPLIRGKSLVLSNDIDPSISLVQADEDRVYQILNNLIGNSIKFTSEGSINILAVEKQDYVEVCVKDTGIGIPKDKLNDVFKSFEQVDASITREQGGTGLGLTITKQLIELHGGKIWLESIQNKGTSVYFTLPIALGEKVAEKEPQSLSKVIEPADISEDDTLLEMIDVTHGINSRFNILIVDDEPINQQVLSNHLTRDNFRIRQAFNGHEALKKLEHEKPDLVLLDIMMPKMSGYEVCKEIRKKYLPSELPVIMITAKDRVPDLVEGLASGANDYLAKPFTRDELLARLKTHLNLYHINAAYLRFIPKEFLKALGHDSIIDVALGDQAHGDMTILFSDIRSFTSITEKLSAKQSFEFLNEFLECITPAITSHGGFIDKYIGDAVMALFPANPEDAIIAGIEAQHRLAGYNQLRESCDKEKIKIGIGIHTGPLMLGTIGVKDRMDGTVISDAVNLASRLEQLNKRYGTSMIVSENTVRLLNDADLYHYRFLSFARVKGKEHAIKVYEFFDGDEDYDKTMKLNTLPLFMEGTREYYDQKFTRASVKFQEVIESYPQDQTARLFLEKSAQYMVQDVPKDWDGVDNIDGVL